MKPVKITATTVHTITLELDSSAFDDYVRQGVVENVKVPCEHSFHTWSESFLNPAASAQFGMLETPDLAKFGRSEQLHSALFGIHEFVKTEKRFPEENNDDVNKCMELAKNKKSELQCEIEEEVFKKACNFAGCSISPMAAFFGGIVAQEIVKYTGKYSPMKQWLHFDIFETLPRE